MPALETGLKEEAEDISMDSPAQPELVTITATIVAAYVSNNSISSTDLPGLIAETHAALSRAAGRSVPQEREEAKPKIAVKKSVMPDGNTAYQKSTIF